jgi:beta-galactosidase
MPGLKTPVDVYETQMIDRRGFLKSSSTLLAAFTLESSGLTQVAAGKRAGNAGRLVLPMNRNWRYSAQHVESATTREFDDSAFDVVTIPHTNKRLPWHSFDEKQYQFISVYRRHFKLPADARGRHVFVDFDGAMTASTVWINGHRLGEYKGGYTPFSFELTAHVDWEGDNVLAVELDSSERADIPPFGGSIDYLTFGGIYREVALRLVPATYLENIFARPQNVLTERPSLAVSCFVANLEPQKSRPTLEAELRDGERVLASARKTLPPAPATSEPVTHELTLANFGAAQRWDFKTPYLYTVVVRIKQGDVVIDEDRRRVGFREARFTDHGFELNGRVVKLRGLNRHQTFPWVGQAMPARVQRRDAAILKKELKINIVRTSHYPQSPYFLDACDELGLLVLEEIPGWQHTGDQQWQDLAVDNVRRMVRRDWNHPSLILWGVRINEAQDNHDFYTRTNAMAHALDPSRQTGGIRNNYQSELLEDVFTMNDFGFPLKPPNHPLYLNTEFIGHTYVTKPYDSGERLTEHALRHARIHNQLGSNPQYAGGIGWCAFDYDTHSNFGSGDRVCYHGVSDIFRLPKPAAYFYKSQCDPAEEIVLEPAFPWSARGDWTDGFTNGAKGVIFSNCDHLKFYVRDTVIAEADPDRAEFGNLPHPPFQVAFNRVPWADLRIEGYVAGKEVIEKQYSSKGVDQQFLVVADDTTLTADGADTTRVAMMVMDEFGNLRRYASAAIGLAIEGPGEIVGDNPFSLVGGCGAIWVRARHDTGSVLLKATHPVLGTRQIQFHMLAAEAERV